MKKKKHFQMEDFLLYFFKHTFDLRNCRRNTLLLGKEMLLICGLNFQFSTSKDSDSYRWNIKLTSTNIN